MSKTFGDELTMSLRSSKTMHKLCIIIVLITAMAAMASSITDSTDSKENWYLHMVTHHKSGTHVAIKYYDLMCGQHSRDGKGLTLRTEPLHNCPRIILSTIGIANYGNPSNTLFAHFIR